MIVLDTNVVSELMKPGRPDIDAWLQRIEPASVFVTVVTRAEIRYGIERLPEGRRRREFEQRADVVFDEVADRMLAFDVAAADHYGRLVARRERAGRPTSTPDGQIAAIALAHHATVATRNTRDFEETGVRVVNPWAVR